MSGAGLCKYSTDESIRPYAEVADAVVVGSITLHPRSGNEGRCEYFDNPLYAANAWGMPNDGSEAVVTTKISHSNVIVSVAEFSPEGLAETFRRLQDGFAAVELNFGCPNTGGEIFSFSPTLVSETLDLVGSVGEGTHLGVKLSPYTDLSVLSRVARAIVDSGVVNYVATKQTGNVGGISGEALKPLSLANARMFRGVLPRTIDVIRVGAISTGKDVWDSYHVGCTGVQVVTAIAQHGPKVLNKIRQEYADIIG